MTPYAPPPPGRTDGGAEQAARRSAVPDGTHEPEHRQGALFLAGGKLHRADDHDTSREAGQAAVATMAARCARVLDLLDAYGPAGATDDQLREDVERLGLGWAYGTVSKRRGDLVEAGLVVATSERRPTRSGSTATVWAIAGAQRASA